MFQEASEACESLQKEGLITKTDLYIYITQTKPNHFKVNLALITEVNGSL